MDAAEDLFGRSLEKFRALSIPSGIATVLSGMAVLALAKGDVGHAERLLEEATSTARHAGPWFLTWALYVRATLAVRHGDPDDAIALMAESLTRIRELHDNFAFVYALAPLIAAAVLKGDDVWAALLVGARDAVTDRTGVTVVDKSARDLQDQSEKKARRRLGRERWSQTYEAGRRTSIESLASDVERRLARA
jgi:ATP/maltotriose-dependent transcriptional regulator MalT